MSDGNQGAASSAEQTIPKSRLDELINRNQQAAHENAFLRGQLEAVQKQMTPRAREQDSPAMERLSKDDPELYKELKRRDIQTKQLSAGFATVVDQNDRLSFLADFPKGKAKLGEVEQVLASERQRGNYNATRAGIYQWMLGNERLRLENEPAPAAANAAPAAKTEDAPPSDPTQTSALPRSSASNVSNAKTREERFEELKNIQF